MTDIKSMGLYRNVDRIMADLEASGLSGRQPISVDDLTPFDQYHYEGTMAVDEAIAFLGPGPQTRILDVGSGLGGPARYIADRTGSRVTAVEIQADLNSTATSLSARCRLDGLVQHINGDILDGVVDADAFDGLLSMLCVLHIPDRAALFGLCARALVSGGRLFIDDYIQLAPFSPGEAAELAEKVYCPYVPTHDRYVADLEEAGFVEIVTKDKTDDWTDFVNSRFERFRSNRAELIERYGLTTVDNLDDFYATVAGLFNNGNLGGLRLTARLP